LTLCPPDWSIQRASKYFEVSNYLIRKSKALVKENGILSMPNLKRGKQLTKETLNLVVCFFESNENSRQMPGMKDFVSISRNVHKQKRLILSNLKSYLRHLKHNVQIQKLGFPSFVT